MNDFDQLAGICPGVSTVREVTSRFGAAARSEASEGGFLLHFESYGICIVVARAERDAPDPLVDEVLLTAPSERKLPCGIGVGHDKADALAMLKRSYRITDEFDDAIYFLPCSRDDLLASVEFRAEEVVVGLELMLRGEGRFEQ